MEKYENPLLIVAPGRSLKSSQQILLHVGSAINENGHVIIINKGKSRKGKPYSVFDIPYFGTYVSKEFGKDIVRRACYPLIFEPIKSVQFLFGISCGNYVPKTCPDDIITSYCRKKGFKLTYLEAVRK